MTRLAPRLALVAPPTIHSDRWADFFRGAGWDVCFVSYGEWHAGAAAVIPELSGRPYGKAIRGLVEESLRLRRLLQDFGPDIVHAHWLSGPAWIAAMSGFRPLVATAWGSDALLVKGASRALTRALCRAAATITYDAKVVAEALVELGFPRDRLSRIVFGADPSKFVPGRPDAAFLAGLGVDLSRPIILSPRGLKCVYEPETILRGFAAASLQEPCQLLVRVSEEDSARWAELQPLVDRLRIGDRVFPYPNVSRDELPRLFCSSTAILSVPSSDGTSVSLLEALFTETPVIVSDLPANREWILDSQFGEIVPVGDAQALSAAIVRAMRDRSRARLAARRAAERARRLGNAEIEFARAHALYEGILDQAGSRCRNGRS